MKKLILIKLGGSVITDKSREFVAREENILRLAGEIKEAKKQFKGGIILGHGAGSFGHTPAKKYQTKQGLLNKSSIFGASVVEEAARRLNLIVVKAFLAKNIPVFSFSPGSFLISDSQVYSKSYIDPIKMALSLGILPMVHGDVVIDKKIGFTIFSTEKVLAVLAGWLSKKYKIRMIYCTDVDGVYDERGETIPEISKKNFDQIKSSIAGAKGVDVTGGMLHKVGEALALAKKYGIETQIINGYKAGNLKKAILGRPVKSTRII